MSPAGLREMDDERSSDDLSVGITPSRLFAFPQIPTMIVGVSDRDLACPKLACACSFEHLTDVRLLALPSFSSAAELSPYEPAVMGPIRSSALPCVYYLASPLSPLPAVIDVLLVPAQGTITVPVDAVGGCCRCM